MKKLLCLLLACAALITVLASAGCAGSIRGTGEEAINNYLEYIRTGDYASAWELLTASVKNETEETKTNRITQKEFEEKYTNIWEALEITAVEYEDIVCSGGEILYSGTFKAVYHSELAGDIDNTFDIVAKREGGYWHIEWSPALILPSMQWGDTLRIAKLTASRGEIIANGQVLAKTAGAVSVYANVDKIANEALFVAQVSRLVNMSEEKVKKALTNEYDGIAIIKMFYSDELSESQKEQLLDIDGVGIDYGNYGTNREYPFGDTLAQLIGYVGSVPNESEDALKAELAALNEGRTADDGLYTSDSRVGRLGLEKQYEKELRGKDGILVYVCTAEGVNRSTVYKREAQNGQDMVLTIDMGLQQRLDDVMKLVLFGETTAGAVVVLDPKTGCVQALCSYPSYDLNLFTRGISSDAYNELLDNPAKPLINRVTQGLYPPGSTMKAFTGACALDLGVLDENYAFDDSQIEDDYWTPQDYGTWIWTPIKRTHINYPIKGALNMRKAYIHSDNIYFANAALKTGWDAFMTYMEKIGFTEAIDFDIGVATPQLYNTESEQTYKLLADSGYGQGEILVTPLQLAAMFGAIANAGDIMTPYVIEGMYEEEGIRSVKVKEHPLNAWRSDVVSDATLAKIVPMLEDVVNPEYNGTGRNLDVSGCKVAAKTGTAEIGNDKSREISWFVGFRVDVEAKDERLVLVMLEIPADTAYTSLKFEIARAMLDMGS